MNSHTQTPWKVWKFDERSIAVGPEVGGLAVAEIVTVNAHGIATAQTEQTGQANAQLIAAAPDLLAALTDLYLAANEQLDQSATLDGLANCHWLAQARHAIAKATGET